MTHPNLRLRQQILAQHTELRRLFGEVDLQARRAAQGDAAASSWLPGVLIGAVLAFERHLEFEEAHLVPVLRRIDAWGEPRAQRLLAEHAVQREMLRDLVRRIRGGAPMREIAAAARALAAEILADMDDEERLSLDEALLADDIVVPAQIDG